MKIYLIGMPGVGKTTIGVLLAQKLHLSFVDLDKYIELKNKKTIPELFSRGEDYFRDCETKALASLAKRKNIIISTGGGIICRSNNYGLMQGKKILLSLDLKELNSRCQKNLNRPLLATSSLEKLFKEREKKYYSFADFIVENTKVDATIKQIMGVIYANFNN